jgi:hypothetical protein
MATAPDPWYVTERSEALAGVLLTSRSDVRIWKKTQLDDRLILHVAIDAGDPVSSATQLFVVQVKGTMSADPSEWVRNVEPWFGHGDDRVKIWLPVCVLVVNVRDNRAVYAWLTEPQVEDGVASLGSSRTVDFHPFDSASVGEIVDRVRTWYQALSKQLQPA